MADKNITLRQKNTSGVYDKLYTKTTATQSKLSTATAALFGDGTSDADAALAKIADTVKSIGNVQVKVVDPNGNPIQGARVTGLYGTPTTASDGTAHGVLQTNPISISSPYIDLKDQTADASGYVGSFDVLVVTLPVVGENAITRITSSKTVKFSKAVKTVDICCVGGGGGGSGGSGHHGRNGSTSYVPASFRGKGGAGGNIVNSYNISITADTSYAISVGAGGVGSNTLIYDASHYGEEKHNPGGQGGSTTFLSVTATGGGGATSTSGVGTSSNGGNGGSGNATGTEFNDGSTYYSGGGANAGSPVYESGRPTIISGPVGGSPYGGYGGYTDNSGSSSQTHGVAGGAGRGAGGGGGGGNANPNGSSNSAFDYMTKGGNGASGLVAIRFHF